MSAPRRLRAVLARQWIGFGLLLFAGFAALALVALWMLEDSFIDARLRDVGGGVRSLDAAPALPPGFALHAGIGANNDH